MVKIIEIRSLKVYNYSKRIAYLKVFNKINGIKNKHLQ